MANKRTVVAHLGQPIGEIRVGDNVYDLISPTGYIAQELDALGSEVKITDAYRLLSLCAPSMPKDVLMQISIADVGRVLQEVQEVMFQLTKEVLGESPKAPLGTSA